MYKDDKSDRAPEYLIIDCKKDVSLAQSIVSIALTKIFGFAADKEFSIEMMNSSQWAELIESPHQGQMPFKSGMQQISTDVLSRTGLSMWEIYLTICLGATQFIGAFGIIYVLAFSGSDWSRIRYEVVGLQVDAPNSGIVFLCLVLLGSAKIILRAYWSPGSYENELRQNGKWPNNPMLSVVRKVFFHDRANVISIPVLIFAIASWEFRFLSP